MVLLISMDEFHLVSNFMQVEPLSLHSIVSGFINAVVCTSRFFLLTAAFIYTIQQNSGFHHPTDEHSDAPAAVAAKSLQSCPTLCDPIDGSLPGS